MTPPPPSPEDQLRRLERRLGRERDARLEAEAIAERSIRDLYHQQQRLQLLEAIATSANLGDDPAGAFQLALKNICDFTGWPTGHVYMFPDDDPHGELLSSGVWYCADGIDRTAFREASEDVSFRPGLGLPGRVLATGKPAWIEDVAVASNFPRAPAAIACDLHGAFAFPALVGEEVGAVLEFFISNPTPPDEELLRTLAQIGAQLGRVVERYRAARRLLAHNEELATLFAQAEVQRQAAEQASRAKSSFLAVTSHEIRTPLNAVLGLSEALRREPLTPRQRDLNDGVLASGQMLLRLLNAVLDMSRIEADRAEARLSDFDLSTKLASIASIWTPTADELGVALVLDHDLGAAGAIRSDEGRIEQTLVNLVSNALKFTPRGGEVRVRAALDAGRLRLEVIDGGPGVDASDLERVFRAFEQTEAGRDAGGAGLGLAICVGNMQLLGGDIGADRTDEGASRFWFECPVEAVEAGAPAVAADVAPQRNLRVLAAEDNPANRRVLEVLLAPAGVALTFAENGRQALDALSSAAFDLILMDVNMPVMDGVEAVRRIRAGEADTHGAPIHMLTANAFDDDVDRYMAAGADGVLTKPIQVAELFAVLGACVASVEEAPVSAVA